MAMARWPFGPLWSPAPNHMLCKPYRRNVILSEERMDSSALPHEHGDAEIRQQLFALLYEELRRIAGRELRLHGAFLTLGTTTLLHEVYLNVQKRQAVAFPDHA